MTTALPTTSRPTTAQTMRSATRLALPIAMIMMLFTSTSGADATGRSDQWRRNAHGSANTSPAGAHGQPYRRPAHHAGYERGNTLGLHNGREDARGHARYTSAPPRPPHARSGSFRRAFRDGYRDGYHSGYRQAKRRNRHGFSYGFSYGNRNGRRHRWNLSFRH